MGCTERSVRLTSTSTSRSVNDVEVHALDIQSPGRPRVTTASEGYGVSVVHVTCSYGATPSTRLQVYAQVRRPCITMC